MKNFVQDDSIRYFFGFVPVLGYRKYYLKHNPVDKLSVDNVFLETDVAQGLIFRGKQKKRVRILTLDVDPGNGFFENCKEGVQLCMMESKDFISNFSFELKNENGSIVTFNGQSKIFHSSYKDV